VVVFNRYVYYVFVKFLPVRVDRQLQPVEASVALRVGLGRLEGNLPDLELLVLAPVALQILEPLDRHPAVASDKVQHILQLLLGKGLKVFPEPDDDLVAGAVVGVEDVVPEVLEVDLCPAVDDHVEFVGLEDGEEVVRDDLVDAQPEVFDELDDAIGAVVLGAG